MVQKILENEFSSSHLNLDSDSKKKQTTDSKKKNNRSLFFFSLAGFLLLIMILLLNSFGFFSCSSKSPFKCFPQYTLKTNEKSEIAKTFLSGVREALKTISYLAKDLSVNMNAYTNFFSTDFNYLNIIDTFSEHIVYKFNIVGFCKKNEFKNNEICFENIGLDIFSGLVKDIGMQLGIVAKAKNPLEIGESFLTFYYDALDKLTEIHEKAVNKEPGFENLNVEALSIISKFKLLKIFGKFMIIASFVSLSICLFVFLWTLIFTVTSIFNRSKFLNNHLKKIFFAVFFFMLLHLIVIVIITSAEFFFYNQLSLIISKFDILLFGKGAGFKILITNLIITTMIEIILISLMFFY